MTDAKQPAHFDWATELSDAQGHVTLSEQEAHEIGARLRSMRVKLKTYEDFGDAGSDVQLLRTCYEAARLEIESLKAQLHAAKQINTAQFGLLTSSIPGSALRASHWQAPAPMSPANRLVAYSAATRLRELGFEWDATAEAWLQPAPSAQAVDHINMDSLRISHCKDAAVIDAARKQGGAT